MPYPDLGDWNSKLPQEAEDSAVQLAEQLAWGSIDQLTAGRVAFAPIVVRPIFLEADGSVRLDGPVGGIQRIRISGSTFSGWRLDTDRLYRLDGEAWVVNDDLGVTPTAALLEVTYFCGFRPGNQLVWAAAELAAEFYAAAAGDRSRKCRLPSGVTSVVRQGVSYEISKPLFANGQTGIREIDVVLGRYNPGRTVAPTLVASVESLARSPRRF